MRIVLNTFQKLHNVQTLLIASAFLLTILLPVQSAFGDNLYASIRGTVVDSSGAVLPGVTVGAGCVVAAGAVVRESCDAHGLYAGVPAVRVRDLEPD